MNRRMLTSLLALAFAGGCASAISGNWKSASEPPKGAAFYIKQIDLHDDNSCSVSAREGDKDLYLRGKYDFNGMQLTLKPEGKPERKYKAVVWWGRQLDISNADCKQTLKKTQ